MSLQGFNGVVSINGKQFLKGVAFVTVNEFWGLVSRVSSGNEPLMIDGVQFKHLTALTYNAEEIEVMKRIFPNESMYWFKD